jgi:hypothetical protein
MLEMRIQEVVTSLLLFKLTRRAHPCQCWPLVLDGDIIYLYLKPQPSLGQGPVWELLCQAQEAEAHTLLLNSLWHIGRRKGRAKGLTGIIPDLGRGGGFPLPLWKNPVLATISQFLPVLH